MSDRQRVTRSHILSSSLTDIREMIMTAKSDPNAVQKIREQLSQVRRYFLDLWAFACSISHVPTRMTRLNRESINL